MTKHYSKNKEEALEIERLRKLLKEVHLMVVIYYYANTNPDSPQYVACRLCSWTWSYGEAESHEETCPLAGFEEERRMTKLKEVEET